MTLKQLKYLLGVVDNGLNITAAAERLYTSQPGISKQLRQLEDEIGAQIFARKGKSLVALTPTGIQVVELARRILQDVRNIRSVGEESTSEQTGALSIATTHTQARYVLPKILRQFHERYPGVQIELHQGTSEQIATLVAEDRVDFAIATESRGQFAELNLLPCFTWDRIVLVPKSHELAGDDATLTLARLAEFPLITYVFSSERSSSFLEAFATEGLDPQVVFTARDADVIKTYARMGMGAAVIAPMALQCEDLDDLCAISATGLFPRVCTWIGIRRDRVFRGYMREFVSLFAPHWPREMINQVVAARSQDTVDQIAEAIDLPVVNGCTKGVAIAA